MPDINITINTPILTGGDYFKTRYRLVGGAYSSYVNRTNATFTIAGLTAGQYELEVILVKDGVECEAIVTPFTITDPYTCVTFTPVIVQNGSLFDLSISYPAHTTPPCGWQIEIIGATTNKIVNYASLPASPLLIPVANEGLAVRVMANLCNGKAAECLNTDVPPIAAACTAMVITGVEVVLNNSYPNGFKGFSIVFQYTQSNPVSKFVTVIINQINVLSGTPGQASYPNYSFGPIPVSGSPSFAPSLVGNSNVLNSLYEFQWLVVDGCGQSHTGTVTKQL